MDRHEMRLDPLTGVWTIFSEARGQRPAFHSVLADDFAPDPFLSGMERYAPHTLYSAEGAHGWQVRVVPNRVPLFRIEGDPTRHGEGFYDRMDGVGAHEIVVEDPGSRMFQDLSIVDLEKVILAWQSRISDLMRDTRMRSFFVVKNVGLAAGAHIGHSLSQVVAMAIVPPMLKQKLKIAREFFATKKRSVFEDILAEEVRAGTRLVYENTGFAAFCPYAARVPFELAIYPKRQCPDFHSISHQETSQLADVLRIAIRKLNRALGHPAYHLTLYTAPTRTSRHDYWTSIQHDFRWHVEIVPRLHHRSGVEMATGCAVNTVWPEVSAEALRALAVVV